MARIRTIKPSFFTSLTIADLTLAQRLTFIGLWTHVDDDGRCIADPRLIKAAIWPLDDRSADDVMSDLGALTEHSLIAHYEVGGRRYLEVCGWSEHQKINRYTKSKLPGPDSEGAKPLTSGNAALTEASVSPHGALIEPSPLEGKGREGKGTSASTPSPSRATPESIEQRVTTDAYEAVGKAFNFIAVRGIAKWALNDRGENPERVREAIVEVHEMGKPITKQTIGQYLDGHIGRIGKPKKPRRDPDAWMQR